MGIGIILKRLKSKTKYSHQDIADMLGVDRSTYINWENETTDIKSQYIPKLAEIFEVDIRDLFEDEKKFQIVNNSKSNDNSIGIIVFNLSDKSITDNLGSQVEEFIKNLRK